MIVDGLSIVTVELAVSAVSYGIFFGTVFTIFSHIINFWDV